MPPAARAHALPCTWTATGIKPSIAGSSADRCGKSSCLQRRALAKDTFPGCWDAAAAGHWRFGETPHEAAREISEELGIEIEFSKLIYRGRERMSRHFANGLTDREFHQVYVLEDDRALSDYRPDPAEVSALGAFSIRDLVAIAEGRLTSLNSIESVTVRSDGVLQRLVVALTKSDLVPYSAARLCRMLGQAWRNC
jgi:hypothetical protein